MIKDFLIVSNECPFVRIVCHEISLSVLTAFEFPSDSLFRLVTINSTQTIYYISCFAKQSGHCRGLKAVQFPRLYGECFLELWLMLIHYIKFLFTIFCTEQSESTNISKFINCNRVWCFREVLLSTEKCFF
jgi:hypothetical protein